MTIFEPYPWPCDTWPPTSLPNLLVADELIRIHNDTLDRLDAAVAEFGGFVGAAKRMVDELEQSGYITSTDNARLKAVIDALDAAAPDADGVLARIETTNEDSRNDTESSAIAIAAIGIAASSVRRALARESQFVNGYAAGMADLVGAIGGTFVLPGAGTLAGEIGASYVAEHVHIDLHVSWL